MTGAHDPDCRRGFPWDDSRWNHELLNYTKAVIALRKEHPVLRRGSYHRLYSEDHFFAFARKLEDRSFAIALNASTDHKKVAFSVESLGSKDNPITIFGPDTHPHIENNSLLLELPPRTGTVISLG